MAKQIADSIKGGGRHVFLLYGEMGAGKTTLVSQVMKLHNKKIHVQSPTFAIINQYTDNIFHIDLYRIENPEYLENLNLREILEGENIVFIEWPCRLSDELLEVAKPYKEVLL